MLSNEEVEESHNIHRSTKSFHYHDSVYLLVWMFLPGRSNSVRFGIFLSIGSDSMPSLKAIVAKKAPFSQTGLGKKLSVEAVLNKGNDEKAPSLALKKAAT